MKLKVFSIYDVKAEAFNSPWMKHTKGQAIREFQDACEDEKHNLKKHPEDYILYELGEWDDSTGQYENLQSPVILVKALDCVTRSSLPDKVKAVK